MVKDDLFADPEAFRPERFADGSTDTYTWNPFGGGVPPLPGRCLCHPRDEGHPVGNAGRCELVATEARPERPRRRFVTYQPDRGASAVLLERLGGACIGVLRCMSSWPEMRESGGRGKLQFGTAGPRFAPPGAATAS